MIKILSKYVDTSYLTPETDEEVHSIYLRRPESPRNGTAMLVADGYNFEDDYSDSENSAAEEQYVDTDGTVKVRQKEPQQDLTLPEISQKTLVNSPGLGLSIASRLIGKTNISRRKSQAANPTSTDKPVAVMTWLKTVSKLIGVLAFQRSSTSFSAAAEDDMKPSDAVQPDEVMCPHSSKGLDLSQPSLDTSQTGGGYGTAKYATLLDLVSSRRKANAHESLVQFMSCHENDTNDDNDADPLAAFNNSTSSWSTSRRQQPKSRRGLFLSDSRSVRSRGYLVRPDADNSYKYVLDDYDNEQVTFLPSYPMPLYRFPERRYNGAPGSPYSALGSIQTSSLCVPEVPPDIPNHATNSEDMSSTAVSWMRLLDPTGTSYEQIHDHASSTMVDNFSVDNDSTISADRSIRSITVIPRPSTSGHIPIDKFYETRTAHNHTRLQVTQQSLLSARLAPLHTRRGRPRKPSSADMRPSTAPTRSKPVRLWNEDRSLESEGIASVNCESMTDSTVYQGSEVVGHIGTTAVTPQSRKSDRSHSPPCDNRMLTVSLLDHTHCRQTDEVVKSPVADAGQVGRVDVPLPRYMRPVGKIRPTTVDGVKKYYKTVTYHIDETTAISRSSDRSSH